MNEMRTMLAGLALAGILARNHDAADPGMDAAAANAAVRLADELLRVLERRPPESWPRVVD